MSLTGRGKAAVTVGSVVAVLGVAAGAMALTGHTPAVITGALKKVTGQQASPPACPLTGLPAPGGKIPARPALAVKIENLPEARPQAGLDKADIVYEEPVEGGITRFISVFQCRQAGRVGPVRSGRTTDPDILRQFGKPLLGYSGGANLVRKAIEHSPVVDLSDTNQPAIYTRDPSRPVPHNLYTTTTKLWAAGKKVAKTDRAAPDPVFTYAGTYSGSAKKVSSVHLPFSSYSDVYWKWSKPSGVWLRSHGTVPHMLDDGDQVQATNVVVQQVKVVDGTIIDPAGNPSPEVDVVGSGKAWVFRDGAMIVGRWERKALSDTTVFTTKAGDVIPLAPGTTWVELLPSTIHLSTSK
jgi:hypothetical protein